MEAMLDIVWMVLMGIVLTRIIVGVQLLNRYKKASKQAMEEEQMNMAAQQEEEKEEPVEIVTDAIDGTPIPKPQAYQLVKDNIVYYFKTWDERQQYIKQYNNSQKA